MAAPATGRTGGIRVIAAAVALLIVAVSGADGRAEPLRLVTGDGYAPYTGRELAHGGLAPQLVRAVYDRMDRHVRVVFRPWKRAQALARRGRFHATFPYVKNEDRVEKFVFSEPLLTLDLKPFVREGDGPGLAEYDDFDGLLGCLPEGWSTGSARFRDMVESGKVALVRPETMKTCFKLLDLDRADFVPAEVPNGKYAARAALGSLDGVRIADLVLNTSTLHVMFPKNQPGAEKAAARFDAALAELRASGRYTKIVTQPMN